MSKPNLPPLPQMDVGVSGQVKFAYSQEALTAYAEEAVRQALAAQVPVVDERKEFEKFYNRPFPAHSTPDDGDCCSLEKCAAWEGWQARAALAPETRDG